MEAGDVDRIVITWPGAWGGKRRRRPPPLFESRDLDAVRGLLPLLAVADVDPVDLMTAGAFEVHLMNGRDRVATVVYLLDGWLRFDGGDRPARDVDGLVAWFRERGIPATAGEWQSS
ncbi:MAG: hypothetical protein R3F61_24075 [Myxococcota bacterium]